MADAKEFQQEAKLEKAKEPPHARRPGFPTVKMYANEGKQNETRRTLLQTANGGG